MTVVPSGPPTNKGQEADWTQESPFLVLVRNDEGLT